MALAANGVTPSQPEVCNWLQPLNGETSRIAASRTERQAKCRLAQVAAAEMLEGHLLSLPTSSVPDALTEESVQCATGLLPLDQEAHYGVRSL